MESRIHATRYGLFQIGSSLSFHRNPVGFTINIVTNIPELSVCFRTRNCKVMTV